MKCKTFFPALQSCNFPYLWLMEVMRDMRDMGAHNMPYLCQIFIWMIYNAGENSGHFH